MELDVDPAYIGAVPALYRPHISARPSSTPLGKSPNLFPVVRLSELGLSVA
jgi:hypothetical protein